MNDDDSSLFTATEDAYDWLWRLVVDGDAIQSRVSRRVAIHMEAPDDIQVSVREEKRLDVGLEERHIADGRGETLEEAVSDLRSSSAWAEYADAGDALR
jgi:hypothetical protein